MLEEVFEDLMDFDMISLERDKVARWGPYKLSKWGWKTPFLFAKLGLFQPTHRSFFAHLLAPGPTFYTNWRSPDCHCVDTHLCQGPLAKFGFFKTAEGDTRSLYM